MRGVKGMKTPLTPNKKRIPHDTIDAWRSSAAQSLFSELDKKLMRREGVLNQPIAKSDKKSTNAKTSLAERLQRLEQQKAKLQLAESKIKDDERKARTRRLIEVGALVEKAGLADLPANALYGALIETARKATDASEVARWETTGGRTFAQEAKARDADKEPLVLSLPFSQPAPVTTALRAAGMRWNKVMRHWEGLAHYEEVLALANEHGGAVRRVSASTAAQAPQPSSQSSPQLAPPPSLADSHSEKSDTAAVS